MRRKYSVLLLLGLPWLTHCGRPPAAPPALHVVQTGRIEEEVRMLGHVRAKQMTYVRSELSGQISAIVVHNGQVVEPGALLVQMDARIIDKEIGILAKEIERTRLSVAKFEQDERREQQLFEAGNSTPRLVEDTVYQSENARLSLEIQLLRLERLQEDRRKLNIVAPHAGIVTNLELEPGAVITGAGSVSSGTPILLLADMTACSVVAEVNEADTRRLTEGLAVTIEQGNDRTTGTISYIAYNAEETRTGGLAFRVLIDLPPVALRLGSTVHLRAITRTYEGVVIPLGFLSGQEVRDAHGDRKPVTCGITDGVQVAVLSGLHAGDQISQP